MPVPFPLHLAVALRGDSDLNVPGPQGVHQLVRVVALVAEQSAVVDAVGQFGGLCDVVSLARSQDQLDRIAERVDARVDLRRGPATTMANLVAVDPPFPPELCWCARTIVASIMYVSPS